MLIGAVKLYATLCMARQPKFVDLKGIEEALAAHVAGRARVAPPIAMGACEGAVMGDLAVTG